MTYAAEQIAFVRFCSENIDCELLPCPLCQVCEEGQEPCSLIVEKMKRGLEPTSDEKEVISYFVPSKRLWKRDDCVPKGSTERCPNASLCDGRDSHGGQWICDELTASLGLYSPQDYEILEREVQKVVIGNLDGIDWEVGERLEYWDHERQTPIGRPDILLRGAESRTLFVVELKPGRGQREHVGQLQSYVGWFKKNMPADFKAVKGFLLAREIEEAAKYAIEANPDLQARVFKLHISISTLE